MEHLGGMDVGESMFMLILTNGTSAKANISWTNMLENPNMCRCKFTGVKNRIHQSWNHYKLSLYHMYFPKVNISKPILHKYLWQFGTSVCVHLFFLGGGQGEKNDDCPIRHLVGIFHPPWHQETSGESVVPSGRGSSFKNFIASTTGRVETRSSGDVFRKTPRNFRWSNLCVR